AGLALDNGIVYVAWSSICDQGSWQGWIMSFETSQLSELTSRAFATNGQPGSGVWHGGGGIAVDGDGYVYVATGNGPRDGIDNVGSSLLKLVPTWLWVDDYFTSSTLSGDTDFGSSGPVFLPNTDIVTVGDKEGLVYVFSTHGLGGWTVGDVGVQQKLPAV